MRQETELCNKLTQWEPAREKELPREVITIAECYRETGLVLLRSLGPDGLTEPCHSSQVKALLETIISISAKSAFFGSQALTLTLIGSHVTDVKHRAMVMQRFFELYRFNRLRVNYEALHLIQESWTLRDTHQEVSTLKLMQQKRLCLMLG